MKKWTFLLLMLLGSVTILPSCSDDDDNEMMSSQTFVTEASSSNMFELQAAGLAKDKSENQMIKAYADDMMRDHGLTGTQMMTLATQHKLTVPQTMLKKHQDMLTALSGKTGTDFEKSYASMMVSSHQEAITLFETAADEADIEDFREFASGKIDDLHHHLDEAQTLDRSMNP